MRLGENMIALSEHSLLILCKYIVYKYKKNVDPQVYYETDSDWVTTKGCCLENVCYNMLIWLIVDATLLPQTQLNCSSRSAAELMHNIAYFSGLIQVLTDCHQCNNATLLDRTRKGRTEGRELPYHTSCTAGVFLLHTCCAQCADCWAPGSIVWNLDIRLE